MNFILIMTGAGVGATLRHALSEFIKRKHKNAFPIATLLINIIGSFIIGGLFASFNRNDLIYNIFAIGLCGGFTTFSTHMLELFELYLSNHIKKAILYALSTMTMSILFCWLGYVIL